MQTTKQTTTTKRTPAQAIADYGKAKIANPNTGDVRNLRKYEEDSAKAYRKGCKAAEELKQAAEQAKQAIPLQYVVRIPSEYSDRYVTHATFRKQDTAKERAHMLQASGVGTVVVVERAKGEALADGRVCYIVDGEGGMEPSGIGYLPETVGYNTPAVQDGRAWSADSNITPPKYADRGTVRRQEAKALALRLGEIVKKATDEIRELPSEQRARKQAYPETFVTSLSDAILRLEEWAQGKRSGLMTSTPLHTLAYRMAYSIAWTQYPTADSARWHYIAEEAAQDAIVKLFTNAEGQDGKGIIDSCLEKNGGRFALERLVGSVIYWTVKAAVQKQARESKRAMFATHEEMATIDAPTTESGFEEVDTWLFVKSLTNEESRLLACKELGLTDQETIREAFDGKRSAFEWTRALLRTNVAGFRWGTDSEEYEQVKAREIGKYQAARG